jgi:uncharacterized membrane protein YhaH (DUF805 family)
MALVSFRGRLRRPVFALLHALTDALLCGVLLAGLVAQLGPHPPSSEPGPVWFLVALGLVAAGLVVVRTSIEVRRLHDLGRSGWWSPAALALYALLFPLDSPAWDAWPAEIPPAQFVLLGVFAVLALAPGDPGTNRFGARPAGRWSLVSDPLPD